MPQTRGFVAVLSRFSLVVTTYPMSCGNHGEGGSGWRPPQNREREDVGLIIVCNSCSAQYSVNDAKVRGKLVRITCKHCATAIVVDGRNMSEAEVSSQKPLASYPLPRRDESVMAAVPQSVTSARDRSPVSAPGQPASVPGQPVSVPAQAPVSAGGRAPVSAPAPAAMPSAYREEEQTMVARSRFGDDMSVHDERTVIGQIPKEALEFERMFAQRTQPPPPEPSAQAPAPAAPVPNAAPLPSFASEPPEPSWLTVAQASAQSAAPEGPEDETKNVPVEIFSRPDSPTLGTFARKSSSDVRAMVSLAEATHPSVARSVTARRVRVTLVTLFVLAVLVALFVIQMPR